MEKKEKFAISIAVFVFLVLGLYILFNRFSNPTGYTISGAAVKISSLEDFAKCLTNNGVKMYGAFWCSHCKEQKEMFGDFIRYINYIECDANGKSARPEECAKAKIESYPTWIIDNQKYSGVKTLEELSKLTGCKI